MRFLATFLFILLCSQSAGAQIVYVVFRTPKIEKRYKKHLVRVNGVDAMVGEPKDGIRIDQNGTCVYTDGAEAKNSLWVADPAYPGRPPYTSDKFGRRQSNKRGKGSVVSFAGYDIAGMKYLDPLMTLEGYANEYNQRMGGVEEMQDELKKIKRGSKEWFTLHGKMIGRYVKVQVWLSKVGFETAAKKMEKAINKERNVVRKDAATIREKENLASVRTLDTPAELIEASKKITGGRTEFHVQESRHMRVTYITDLADDQVTQALQTIEQIAEGFRREFIDPYIDDDFPDLIPDEHPLVEFYFGPPDLAIHEKFLIEFYKHKWGKFKKEEMAASGALFYLPEAPYYLHYRKLLEGIDLEGYLAHGLGSAMADMHYNSGRRNDRQPWLNEASGYYTALGYLGRNNITTFGDGAIKYAQSKQESGVKTVKSGLRGFYNEQALRDGLKIDAIAPKELYQLTDQDFSKGWSFFEFVGKKLGRDGQIWLRSTCNCAADRATFMDEWRKASEKLHPVGEKVDVFTEIENQWKRYAEREQISETER